MSFGNPPMPTRIGQMANATCDIYTMSATVGAGGVGVGTWALTHSQIPCSIQEMSSNEQLRYGGVTETTLYQLFLPLLKPTGTDIELKGSKTSQQFQIDGVRYEAIGVGVKQRDGLQKIAMRRVGVV